MCYIGGVCRTVEPMDARDRYRIVIAMTPNASTPQEPPHTQQLEDDQVPHTYSCS
jgi:hypothetical protein